MNKEEITEIILRILSEKNITGGGEEGGWEVPVEVSARHVHLTEEAIQRLFGAGARLTEERSLSQPGQFLSKERVALVTQKGRIDQVAVLGPARSAIQVELSATDCRQLGIQAPVRLSGDLTDAADIYLVGPKGMIEAKESVIVAQAHIHIPPQEAKQAGIWDGEEVSVTIGEGRRITLESVICRVSDQAGLAMHIDFDEANACFLSGNTTGQVRRKEGQKNPKQASGAEQNKQRTKENREKTEEKISERLLVTENSLSCLIGGKLMTEEAARQLTARAAKELTVSKEIILTPSAKDFLRQAGVHVVRQGGHEI